MIEIRGLNKSFGGLRAIEDVTMTLHDGIIYGLIGQSGSGKSTLLRCINGLIPYDSGSIRVGGTEVASLSTRSACVFRKQIGMIFQNFSLLNRLNVYDNVALPMKCWKYSKKEIHQKVSKLLELVHIFDKKNSFPSELSGGQKQRVAIARALTLAPKILLCDEATSALDPRSAENIMDLIIDIHREFRMTILIVTHQLSIVQKYCKNVFLIEKGKLYFDNTVLSLFTDPPPQLLQMMGDKNNLALPSHGVTLRITPTPAQSDSPFLARLAQETGESFKVLYVNKEQFFNGIFASVIINCHEDALRKICNFLEHSQLTWQRMAPIRKEDSL